LAQDLFSIQTDLFDNYWCDSEFMLKTLFAIGAFSTVVVDYGTFHSRMLELDVGSITIHDLRSVATMLAEVPVSVQDDDPTGCKECVRKVAQADVAHGVARLEEICKKDGQKPRLKGICEGFKKEPEIVKGAIMFWSHPILVGVAYCIGAKKCTHKDEPPSVIDEEMTFEDMEGNELLGLMKQKETMADFQDSVQGSYMMTPDVSQSLLAQPYKTCVAEHTIEQWKKTIHKVVAWCKKVSPKCPFAKKFCQWGKDNPKNAAGFILAATQPCTYARGFCSASQKEEEMFI